MQCCGRMPTFHRSMQQGHLKQWYPTTTHDVITQKNSPWIFADVKTSYPALENFLLKICTAFFFKDFFQCIFQQQTPSALQYTSVLHVQWQNTLRYAGGTKWEWPQWCVNFYREWSESSNVISRLPVCPEMCLSPHKLTTIQLPSSNQNATLSPTAMCLLFIF